jgi:DNA helicase HerA-like ATPase
VELDVGELALAPGVPVSLDAAGFGRHTFLCGQSGSGKTYSLGVLLDRLLLETRLRIVILDPNSDFSQLAASHPHAQAADAERWLAEVAPAIAVRSGTAAGRERLRLRFGELNAAAQAGLLRLDPIADREEYAVLAQVLAEARPEAVEELVHSDGRDERAQLALRIRNLGLERLGIWARHDPGSVLDELRDPAVRCLVVDLGSLSSREEQALTAAAVLDRLWQTRAEREPVLVVIDEAHNVCPASPPDAMTALARRAAVDIAAEGRKFGLYLLLASQRPQKIAQDVLSQCDNLVLMRLNSEADGEFARELFSFVPAGLVARAPAFRQGEALVAGPIAPHPLIVRFGERFSAEGGADVPATWAQPA